MSFTNHIVCAIGWIVTIPAALLLATFIVGVLFKGVRGLVAGKETTTEHPLRPIDGHYHRPGETCMGCEDLLKK